MVGLGLFLYIGGGFFLLEIILYGIYFVNMDIYIYFCFMDTGLIKFIEYYKDSIDNDKYTYVFDISCEKVSFNGSSFFRSRDPFGIKSTIRLDKEDLDYLYNKYYPKYKEVIIKRDEELKVQKEQEIKELENKLNKLKNDK